MSIRNNKKIMVGMSGGVDSSVTAMLLQQQGFEVQGVFMRNWEAEQDDPYCTADQDLTDARSVCDKLGIPLQTVNFAKQYWDHVFQYFLDEYSAGRTPNPDILCNQEIKFKAFLDYALQQGADYMATGHYARKLKINDQFYLLKGSDPNKDQSYFLCRLQPHQLAHAVFPLGEFFKPQVRELARTAGFINSKKKDSTGICFIGERKFKDFLREYLLAKPGDIETVDGDKIGNHEGLMFYTLGQRQGLGIGGRKNAIEAPWYVVDKDITRNTLIVAQQHDHPRLLKTSLICKELAWVSGHAPTLPLRCKAKTRYRQLEQSCQVSQIDEYTCLVEFEHAQWAITPGQSVVFYDHEVCLGGGIIQ